MRALISLFLMLRLAVAQLVARATGRPTYASSRRLRKGRYAASASEIDTDAEWVLVVPIGSFQNHHNGAHEVTREHVEQMAKNFAASSTDLLVDYDHASLYEGDTRAAGWSAEVRVTDAGLEMRMPEFTKAASQQIDDKEYRYFSPVYELESTGKDGAGRGARILSVAITSFPYFDEGEIDPIGNSASAQNPPTNPQPFMEREALIQALGLADDATDEQINEALAKAKAAPEPAPETAANSQAKPDGKAKANSAAEGDDDPVAQLAAQVAELSEKLEAKEQAETEAGQKAKAEALVNSAIEAGKLLPSEKKAYVNSAVLDFAETKAELDKREKGSAMPQRVKVNSGSTSTERRAAGRGHAYLDKALSSE
jgi:phage I-like protein